MKVLITNPKGIYSFNSYTDAAEFRQEMVWSLTEAEFEAAYTSAGMNFTYSNLTYWTDGEDE